MKPGLKLIVSLGVLVFLFLFLPWQVIKEAGSRLSLAVWLAVLFGFFAGHGLGIVKWRLLLRVGQSRLRCIDAVRCYAAGLFTNLCLPSVIGGDVLRAVLAGKATGRPEAVTICGVADRLIDMIALGLLVGAGGWFAGAVMSGWRGHLLIFGMFVGGGGALASLLIILRRPLSRWTGRYRRVVGRGLAALRRLRRNPETAATALLISLLMQSAFVLLNAWIASSIGIVVPLGVWFLVWPLAKVTGMLPISLGGLGVRDAALAALLVPFAVPLAQGLMASLIWQTVLVIGGLISGLIWWVLSGANVRGMRMDSSWTIAGPS